MRTPLILVLAAVACGAPPRPLPVEDNCIPVDIVDRQVDTAVYAEVGKPVSVTFARSVNPTCGGAPRSVEAHAYDVTTRELAVDTSFSMVPATGERRITATFTPVRGGFVHVSLYADWADGESLFQLDLPVHELVDKPIVGDLPGTCQRLSRTSKGSIVCDATVYRGASVEPLPAPLSFAAGDSVWVLGGTSVRRYTDSGTQLTLVGEATLPCSPTSAASFAEATETDLYFVCPGTELVHVNSTPAVVSSVVAPGNFLMLKGDTLYVIATQQLVNGSNNMQACVAAYGLDLSPKGAVRCIDSNAMTVGKLDGRFWLLTMPFFFGGDCPNCGAPKKMPAGAEVNRVITALDVSGSQLTTSTVTLSSDYDLAVPHSGAAAIYLRQLSIWSLPGLTADGFQLTRIETDTGYSFAGASDSLLWETRALDGHTRIRAR